MKYDYGLGLSFTAVSKVGISTYGYGGQTHSYQELIAGKIQKRAVGFCVNEGCTKVEEVRRKTDARFRDFLHGYATIDLAVEGGLTPKHAYWIAKAGVGCFITENHIVKSCRYCGHDLFWSKDYELEFKRRLAQRVKRLAGIGARPGNRVREEK